MLCPDTTAQARGYAFELSSLVAVLAAIFSPSLPTRSEGTGAARGEEKKRTGHRKKRGRVHPHGFASPSMCVAFPVSRSNQGVALPQSARTQEALTLVGEFA